jgi:hypothetical protein
MKPKTKEQCLCVRYVKNVRVPVEGFWKPCKESWVYIYKNPECTVGDGFKGGPIKYRGRKLKSGAKMLDGVWVWLELVK